MWKDIQVRLQVPEIVLTIFHIGAPKALTPPGDQEAGALALVRDLAADP